MIVKLVNGRESSTYQCSHIQVTEVLPGTVAEKMHKERGGDVGVTVELFPQNEILHLPSDGQSIYVVDSETRKTVDAYHWPPRTRQPQSSSGSSPVPSRATG